MVERCDRKDGLRGESVDPVGDGERVALGLAVAQAKRAVTAGSGLVVVGVGIVGNLEEVLAILPRNANLITGGLIADKRQKSASGVGGIVIDGGNRSCQPVVRA